jgi:predicted secreted Zn-dependent protease
MAAEGLSQESDTVLTIAPELERMPNTTVLYYEIAGSTEAELREQMDLLRPKNEKDTAQYDAQTGWTFQWSWPGKGTTECDVSKASVSFHITVTLPHWTPPENAPEPLLEKWEKYMHALVAHEKGHVDNVVASYAAVLSAIKNADCYTANESAKAAVDRIRKQEEFYDAVTNHGIKRGAIFP